MKKKSKGKSKSEKKPGKLQGWLLSKFREINLRIENRYDKKFLARDVSTPPNVGHGFALKNLADLANKPGSRILEVGSREVTGPSKAREIFTNAQYVGFDYYPGNNVDVVGDAHKLSSYFSEQDKFDLIYSSACFEHFAMPWIVAVEMAKLLKIGGIVFVETHFAFSTHERPWHFFHFSDMGLRVLFSDALGIECIESGMSNPIVGRFSSLAAPYLRNQPVKNLYCHSEYLGRKVREVNDFHWENIDIASLVGDTKYPEPKDADATAGIVIYKRSALDSDSQAAVLQYRKATRYSTGADIVTSKGETIRLVPSQDPLYIPEPGTPGGDKEEALAAIAFAEKRFPQFAKDLSPIKQAWTSSPTAPAAPRIQAAN